MRSEDLPVTAEELYSDKCYDCKYLRARRNEAREFVYLCGVAFEEAFDENYIMATMPDWCRLKQILEEMRN